MNKRSFDTKWNQGGRSFDGNKERSERREFTPADKLKQQLREADMRVFIGNPKRFEPKLDKLPIIVIDSWKDGKEWIVISDQIKTPEECPTFKVMKKQDFQISTSQETKGNFIFTTFTIK